VSVRTSAPVVGFNHNVKHGQRVYHVQTEDSGLPHAHFITHLFLGGNIVATQKSSYADRAGDPDLPKVVRAMMEEQHKNMLRRLVAGEFQEMSERLSAPHYEPGVLATGQTGPAAVNVAKTAPVAGAAVARPAAKPEAVRRVAPVPAVPSPAPPKRSVPPPVVARAPATSVEPAAPEVKPAPAKPAPSAAAPAAASAAPAPAAAPPIWQPAPPGVSNPSGRRMPGAPLPQTTRMPPLARSSLAPPTLTPSAPVRPAAKRPNAFPDQAASFESPHENLPTLFAEELISEKSLDEVILAFLSADLEPQK
jgi:hypothetical protein